MWIPIAEKIIFILKHGPGWRSQLYYKNKDRMNENSTLLGRYTFEYILTSFKNLLKCAKSAEHRKKRHCTLFL